VRSRGRADEKEDSTGVVAASDQQAGVKAFIDATIKLEPSVVRRSLHEEAVLQQRIVDDLQDLALAEAGNLAYHRVAVDLTELLETCRTAHHARAESARVSLSVAAEPVAIHADPDRLARWWATSSLPHYGRPLRAPASGWARAAPTRRRSSGSWTAARESQRTRCGMCSTDSGRPTPRGAAVHRRVRGYGGVTPSRRRLDHLCGIYVTGQLRRLLDYRLRPS
jgi:hypothetical protein